jgi:hypothetical protein
MNQNFKVTAIATAVLIVGLSSLTVYRVSSLNKKQEEIKLLLQDFEKQLPKGFIQTNNIEKGILQSSGKYNLSYSDPKTKDISSLVITYKLTHGINYLLTGTLESDSVGNLEGNVNNLFEKNGDLFKSKTIFSSSGDIETNVLFSDLKLKDSLDASLKGMSYHVQYIKAQDFVKSDLKINEIMVAKNNDSLNIKNIEGSYNSHIKQIDGGNLSFKIGSAKSKDIEASGFSVASELINNKNTINIESNIKLDKFSGLSEKDSSFELKYSLKNLDLKSMEYFFNLAQNNPDPKIIETKLDEIKVNIKTIIQSGFSFSIDKLYAKGSFGQVNFNASLNLPKVNSIKDVSFAKNLTLDSNLTLSGNSLPVVYTTFNTFVMNKEAPQEEVQKLKEFTWKTKMKNSIATINNEPIYETQAQILKQTLESLDLEFNK